MRMNTKKALVGVAMAATTVISIITMASADSNRPRFQSCEDTGVKTCASYGANGAVYIFTEVTRQGLGEGWRDPSGLIWFYDALRVLTGDKAVATCSNLGSRLPTAKEFQQLALYMGATLNPMGLYDYQGFSPQVFSDLSGDYYWSDTPAVAPPNSVYIFNGYSGQFNAENSFYAPHGVICVAQ